MAVDQGSQSREIMGRNSRDERRVLPDDDVTDPQDANMCFCRFSTVFMGLIDFVDKYRKVEGANKGRC